MKRTLKAPQGTINVLFFNAENDEARLKRDAENRLYWLHRPLWVKVVDWLFGQRLNLVTGKTVSFEEDGHEPREGAVLEFGRRPENPR